MTEFCMKIGFFIFFAKKLRVKELNESSELKGKTSILGHTFHQYLRNLLHQ